MRRFLYQEYFTNLAIFHLDIRQLNPFDPIRSFRLRFSSANFLVFFLISFSFPPVHLVLLSLVTSTSTASTEPIDLRTEPLPTSPQLLLKLLYIYIFKFVSIFSQHAKKSSF